MSNESGAGGGGGSVGGVFGSSGFTSPATLIQKAQGLRLQLATAEPAQRSSVMTDYQSCLEFLPYGRQDVVREIIEGVKVAQAWIDGSASEARDLALREYPSLTHRLAEKITRKALDHALNRDLDPICNWHSDHMTRPDDSRRLIAMLQAMPAFARLTVKVIPPHEMMQFVGFNVYTMKENFDGLAVAWRDPAGKEAYRRVSAELVDALADGLLEILATAVEPERLTTAHQVLMGLLPHLSDEKAAETDAVDTRLLNARQLSKGMALSTNDAETHEFSRNFALMLSSLPGFVVRHLIHHHVETVKAVCEKFRKNDHRARILATWILLIPTIEIEESAPSLVQLMQHMSSLMPHLPVRKSAPRQLDALHEAWNQIFSAKLANHPSPFVRDAAQVTALHLHRMRNPAGRS